MRMASGQGALGESPELLVPVFEAGVDYVVCDSLAESTTSTLALDRRRDEALGYAPDLAARLAIALPYVVERGTRLVTNAGGVNPVAAHQLAVAAARNAGFRGLRIGLVCAEMERPPDARAARSTSARTGVARALAEGADIVITGRVADASLFLAPLVARARLGVGRLGPARGGHPRRPPARVLGPEPRRQLLRRLVGHSPHPGIAVPDRRGRRRRRRRDHEAGRHRAAACRPTRCATNCSTRCTTRRAYLSPDVVADFTSVTFEETGPDRVRVRALAEHPVRRR